MNAGIYSGAVQGAESIKSQKGTPGLEVRLQVAHVWAVDKWQSLNQPESVTSTLWLTENAWGRSQGILVGMGFNGDFSDPKFSPDAVTLECKHETYEGKAQEKWEICSENTRQAASGDENRSLSAKWNMSAPSSASAPPPPVPAAAAPISTAPPGPPPPGQTWDEATGQYVPF